MMLGRYRIIMMINVVPDAAVPIPAREVGMVQIVVEGIPMNEDCSAGLG